MSPSIRAAVTMAFVLVGGTRALADPIVITRDARVTRLDVMFGTEPRRIETNGPGDVLTSTTSSPVRPGQGVARATMTSSFADPLHWAGVGAASVSVEQQRALAFAEASFLTFFQVTSPVNYAFNGTLAASGSFFPPETPDTGGPIAEAFLAFNQNPDGQPSSSGGLLFSVTTPFFGGNGSAAINPVFSGTLAPGVYALGATAGGIGNVGFFGGGQASTATFGFTLDFSPVASPTPEPGSFLLLASGIVGASSTLRSRWKRASHPSPEGAREQPCKWEIAGRSYSGRHS